MLDRLFASFAPAALAFCLSLPVSAKLEAATSNPELSEREKQTRDLVNGQHPAVPAPRLTRVGDVDQNWMQAHENNVAQAKQGGLDVLFIGDSITAGWKSYPEVWEKYFGAYKAARFAYGGDRTQHVLWRLTNGELDGPAPKAVVLLIGTNNIGAAPEPVAQGVRAIVELIKEKQPKTKVLLLGVFPRGVSYHDGGRRFTRELNTHLAKLADGETVRYLDLTQTFLRESELPLELFPDRLHLSREGYAVWGEAMAPALAELLRP